MKQSYLTDGYIDADVITAERHIFLQLKGFVEIRYLTERGQEGLHK
jgi:hypothetical protein